MLNTYIWDFIQIVNTDYVRSDRNLKQHKYPSRGLIKQIYPCDLVLEKNQLYM